MKSWVSAMNQAERLKSCITGRPIELPRLSITFTISMGAVVKYNATVDDLDSLIQAADAALYQAKVEGRNRIVMSGSHSPYPRVSRSALRHELA